MAFDPRYRWNQPTNGQFLCFCNNPAVGSIVTKPSVNRGRQFFMCRERFEGGCKFYKFADDAQAEWEAQNKGLHPEYLPTVSSSSPPTPASSQTLTNIGASQEPTTPTNHSSQQQLRTPPPTQRHLSTATSTIAGNLGVGTPTSATVRFEYGNGSPRPGPSTSSQGAVVNPNKRRREEFEAGNSVDDAAQSTTAVRALEERMERMEQQIKVLKAEVKSSQAQIDALREQFKTFLD